jgi:hypothetical protein
MMLAEKFSQGRKMVMRKMNQLAAVLPKRSTVS